MTNGGTVGVVDVDVMVARPGLLATTPPVGVTPATSGLLETRRRTSGLNRRRRAYCRVSPTMRSIVSTLTCLEADSPVGPEGELVAMAPATPIVRGTLTMTTWKSRIGGSLLLL